MKRFRFSPPISPTQRHRLYVFAILLFSASRAVAQDQEIRLEGHQVIVTVQGRDSVIGSLATDDDPVWGYDEISQISPDGAGVVFAGKFGDGVALFLYRRGMSDPLLLDLGGSISWRSMPIWSADSRLAAFSVGGRIWISDQESLTTFMVTVPPESWMNDVDPWFSDDSSHIFFYRGSTFEFSFVGSLYSIDLESGLLAAVFEENPRYPSEDLAGAGSMEYSEHDLTFDLVTERAYRFGEDLLDADLFGLYLAFDRSYAGEQLRIMHQWPGPLTEDVVSSLIFNGAAMYSDYSNTIRSILEIVDVLEIHVDDLSEMITFTVLLEDDRVVVFSLFWTFDTLAYYGAMG